MASFRFIRDTASLPQASREWTAELRQLRAQNLIGQRATFNERIDRETEIRGLRNQLRRANSCLAAVKQQVMGLTDELRLVKSYWRAQRALDTRTYLKTEWALRYLAEHWPNVFVEGVIDLVAQHVWGKDRDAKLEHDLELRILVTEKIEETTSGVS